ncbi:MAG: M50 family metallopeptidase [Patescibacteria group bacterium]
MQLPKINVDWGKVGDLNIQNFDFHSPFGKLILLISAILLLSFVTNYLLSRSIFGRGYRIFVAPGVIVHEFSHALMCLVTGAKISKMSLFDKEGGKVEHTSPKIPIIGQIVISLAPIFFGAVVIYFLSRRLGINSVDFATIHLTKEGIAELFKSVFSNLNFRIASTWIILYLVLSITATLTPSFQDLRNIVASLGFIGIIIFLVYRFSAFRFNFNLLAPDQIVVLLSTVSLLLILGLILSIILYITSKLISR